MEYQICKKCIMDTSDPDISFDSAGICNHCHNYTNNLKIRTEESQKGLETLKRITAKIINSGKRKKYDCILGVSGGVDSSYLAYYVKYELGLNPLAIHFDNGWNSELANSNIEQILGNLEIELFTYPIDWPTFAEIQKCFLFASTPDGEIPTDHAITALLYQEASKRGIKYIISGLNFKTESLLPIKWSYGHIDWKYIKSIIKEFGEKPIKIRRYPHFSFLQLIYWNVFRRIKIITPLNYIDYNKESALKLLEEKFNYRRYSGKHYESIYTRFYQGYLLPKKFGIEKKRAHLSNLILADQLSRSEALLEIKKIDYPENLRKEDEEFVLKKLDFTKEEFNRILDLPTKSFMDYGNNFVLVMKIRKIINLLRAKNILNK